MPNVEFSLIINTGVNYEKKAYFTDSQILAISKQAVRGVPIPELCREYGMGNSIFYKWRAKYEGLDVSLITRMKGLEDENHRLKKMYIEVRINQRSWQKSGKGF